MHLKVYKLRFHDGTFALKGIPKKGQRHGGKAWSLKGHLKSAIKCHTHPVYRSGPGRFDYNKIGEKNWIFEMDKKKPFTVLEISGEGVKEYTLEEFMKL
jgi:hypothetical protein